MGNVAQWKTSGHAVLPSGRYIHTTLGKYYRYCGTMVLRISNLAPAPAVPSGESARRVSKNSRRRSSGTMPVKESTIFPSKMPKTVGRPWVVRRRVGGCGAEGRGRRGAGSGERWRGGWGVVGRRVGRGGEGARARWERDEHGHKEEVHTGIL